MDQSPATHQINGPVTPEIPWKLLVWKISFLWNGPFSEDMLVFTGGKLTLKKSYLPHQPKVGGYLYQCLVFPRLKFGPWKNTSTKDSSNNSILKTTGPSTSWNHLWFEKVEKVGFFGGWGWFPPIEFNNFSMEKYPKRNDTNIAGTRFLLRWLWEEENQPIQTQAPKNNIAPDRRPETHLPILSCFGCFCL